MRLLPFQHLAAFPLALSVLVVALCARAQESDYRFDRAEFQSALRRGADRETLKGFYRRPRAVPVRPMPFPVTDAMRKLGERLFFDTRLGASGNMGCVTCHDPQKSFSDNLPQSVELSRRRSMTLYDLAWNTRFGWDGSINGLMSQAILAIEAPGAMATPRTALTARIANDPDYVALMKTAYKGSVKPGTEVHFEVAAHALEVYVGSLVSPRTRFDRWIEGDESAVSVEAKQGFDLFHARAACAECHMSWRFTDGMTHDIGLNTDLGLATTMGPKPEYLHHFKTPGLREVGRRAPYMHDGSLPSLDAVLLFYSRGGNIARPSRSPHVRPLGLTENELSTLQAFLDTLTSTP